MQLRRTIRVPVQRLYRAFEDSADRAQWLSTRSSVELVVGGKFESDIGAEGTFVEVVPMERWRLEWSNPNHKPGSRVVIEFCKNGRYESCMHIRHWRIKSKKDYQEICQGWRWVLDCLESYLERGMPIEYHSWLQNNMLPS